MTSSILGAAAQTEWCPRPYFMRDQYLAGATRTCFASSASSEQQVNIASGIVASDYMIRGPNWGFATFASRITWGHAVLHASWVWKTP